MISYQTLIQYKERIGDWYDYSTNLSLISDLRKELKFLKKSKVRKYRLIERVTKVTETVIE